MDESRLEHPFPACVLGNPPSQEDVAALWKVGYMVKNSLEEYGGKPSELVLFTAGLLRVFTMQVDADTLHVGAAVWTTLWGKCWETLG